jgi:thioredoxin 1
MISDEGTAIAGPVEVTDETFKAQVMESSMPVLVEFYSPQCGHCNKMVKVLDALAGEMAGTLKIARVNVLENSVTPEAYGVSGIPAFFLVKNGETVSRALGAMPKGRLKKELGLS